MRKVLGALRRADEDYHMIEDGDTVAVGISGGKDSMVLLYALHLYQNFCKVRYSVRAYTVDLGFTDFDISVIEDYCASLEIPFTRIKTDIAKIVFDVRKEKNPCALCAKMRKGALFTRIKQDGMAKCVFGHHREDCLESLLMSMLYEGRMRTFKPNTFLDREGITLLRPLIYLPEKDIVSAAKRNSVPTSKNPCPASGVTKREEIKKLLAHMNASNPDASDKLLTALKNTAQYSLWDPPQ